LWALIDGKTRFESASIEHLRNANLNVSITVSKVAECQVTIRVAPTFAPIEGPLAPSCRALRHCWSAWTTPGSISAPKLP
jgi:hypothetical protein